MKNSFKVILVVAIVTVLYFTISSTTKTFDDNSLEVYRDIEGYFINQTHANEMNDKSIDWLTEQIYDLESSPDSFTDHEKYIIDNLITMYVQVGYMNVSPYRDRVLEEEYYNARDSVMRVLFDGE